MAGIGALAHGNDIGGSLRFPAAANGAVTIKSGLGRVPAWNPSQKAERGLLAQSMSVQGLITRAARDLHLAMPVLIQPDPRDPFHVPLPWHGPRASGPIRVAVTKSGHGFGVHPRVEAAIDHAAAALRDAGYVVEDVEPPLLYETAREGYRALMGEVKTLMGPDIRAHGSDTIRSIFDTYFVEFPPLVGDELLHALARRSHFARAWSVFLDRYPLVLTPFMLQPFFAPGRDTEGRDGVVDALGTAIYSYSMNYLGLPAGCLPALLADLPQGPCPINVQLIGQRWREDMVVDAMIAVEDRLGGLSETLWDRMS